MASGNIPISGTPDTTITAPTPQNTPLNTAPISSGTGLSRPTVPTVEEGDEEGEGGVRGMSDAVLGLVQGRLAGLVGKSSGYIENLPPSQKVRVQALKGVQVGMTELQNQYKRECLELEKKYLNLSLPLYERRRQIIHGEADGPKSEEIEKGEEQSKKDDEDYTPLTDDVKSKVEEDAIKGIPEFWLTALRNHLGIVEQITERDEEALKSLKDISLTYLTDKPGFKLTFTFGSNEFFEDEMLEKTYIYKEELGYSGDFIYDRAIGTKIKWKEDSKDLTKEYEIKKQRNKNTNQTRLVRKARPAESFFNFFNPPQMPEDVEDIEEDELEEIEEKLEVDYQIGEDLKEKVIPRAIDYFTGKALEYDMMENDSDFGSSDDDEDHDGEEHTDDDEGEDLSDA